MIQNSFLDDRGLNLQAVFNIEDVPDDIQLLLKQEVESLGRYRQLILLGNGGKKFWQAMHDPELRCTELDCTELDHTELNQAEPVDSFTVQSVKQYLSQFYSDASYLILYPHLLAATGGGCETAMPATSVHIPLQRLGAFAGWQHESPLKIGINAQWGLWFAYRALVLVDSDIQVSAIETGQSACDSCTGKACIAACPAKVVAQDSYDFNGCLEFRLQTDSMCAESCLSRLSCPVQKQHQYTELQLNYHYRCSLKHF